MDTNTKRLMLDAAEDSDGCAYIPGVGAKVHGCYFFVGDHAEEVLAAIYRSGLDVAADIRNNLLAEWPPVLQTKAGFVLIEDMTTTPCASDVKERSAAYARRLVSRRTS